MNSNILGLVISFVYIIAVLIVSTFLKGNKEVSRKFIHILVGNWVFITPLFTQPNWLLVVPLTFVVLNYLSHRFVLIKSMERENDTLGTVYYAISIVLLCLFSELVQNRLVCYVGILIMTYGDGLAALIGQRISSSKLVGDKTLGGTFVVFFVSFVVVLVTLILNSTFDFVPVFLMALFIGILSGLIELTSKKGLDNLLLPLSSGFVYYVLVTNYSVGLIVYLFICLSTLLFAYQKKSITLDGVSVALLVGVILFGLGNEKIGLGLLGFFILGSIVSKLKNKYKLVAQARQPKDHTRNYKQVLCNSLPAVILVLVNHFILHDQSLTIVALVVFAGASGDTFASEIGMMSSSQALDLRTFKPVGAGVSGAISLLGILASLIGSGLIALLAWPEGFWLIWSLGFLNMLIDSMLGAFLQVRYQHQELNYVDIKTKHKVSGFSFMSNNMVNLVSLTLTVMIGVLL